MSEPAQHTFSGQCLCGAVRYQILAAIPRALYLCHCTRCRKETGTLHGANAFFRTGTLSYQRGEDALSRFTLEGTRKKRVFCSTCASPMPRQEADGLIVLPVGSLDDDSMLTPSAHIFYDDRASWDEAAATCSKLAGSPF